MLFEIYVSFSSSLEILGGLKVNAVALLWAIVLKRRIEGWLSYLQ